MLAKTLRFVSLLCAAVALGLTLTHDLEIAGKHSLDGAEWLHVQHTFYGGFAIVGGIAEVLGLISTCVLLVLLRGQQPSFILTLLAALSFLDAGFVRLWEQPTQPADCHLDAGDVAGQLAAGTRRLGPVPRHKFCPGGAGIHRLTR
jgi:hypothetical protein